MGIIVFFFKEIIGQLDLNLIIKLSVMVFLGGAIYTICVQLLYPKGYFRLIGYFKFKK